jgi:hypothetical protein
MRPRPAVEPPESLDTYRQMLVPESQRGSPQWRMVKNGAMGLAIFGVAGWVWRNKNRVERETTDREASEQAR